MFIHRKSLLLFGSRFGLFSLLCLSLGPVPAWSQPPTIDIEDVLGGVTGQTPAVRHQKAWDALRAPNKDKETTHPQQTIEIYRAFLAQNPRLTPLVGVDILHRIAQMQDVGLKQKESAGETYASALKLYARDRKALMRLLFRHSQWLNRAGRSAEVIALLELHWPQVQKSWTHLAVPVVEQGQAALKASGQKPQQVRFLALALRDFPELTTGETANWDNIVYKPLIDTLLQEGAPVGQGDEAEISTQKQQALGWAKLRFVTAPYETGALERATRMLTRVWSAAQPSRTGLLGFAAAQRSSDQPNPLRAVELPPLEIENLAAHLEAMGAGNAHNKITLLLWAQKPVAAMRMAQGLFENRSREASGQGVLEVARVFKATDLNLLRANAFLSWSKDKQGPSPIEAFYREQAEAALQGDGALQGDTAPATPPAKAEEGVQ